MDIWLSLGPSSLIAGVVLSHVQAFYVGEVQQHTLVPTRRCSLDGSCFGVCLNMGDTYVVVVVIVVVSRGNRRRTVRRT